MIAEPAFFRKGAGVSGCGTSEEAIIAANLDYEVAKVKLVTVKNWVNNEGVLVDVSGREYTKGEAIPDSFKNSILRDTYATVRTDNGLTLTPPGKTVTASYEVVQNRQAFNMIDDIIGSKEAVFETAGFFGRGEEIYLSAKFPSFVLDINNDVIEDYIIMKLSHDGTGGVKVFMSPIRVVCENTLTQALRGCKNVLTFKHTAKVADRMNQVSALLQLHTDFNEKLLFDLQMLRRKQLTGSIVTDFMDDFLLVPSERAAIKNGGTLKEINKSKFNTMQELFNSIESGVGQEYHRGSALWLFNGVSTHFNNKSFKSDEHKFKSLYEGDASKKVQRAYDLVMELV